MDLQGKFQCPNRRPVDVRRPQRLSERVWNFSRSPSLPDGAPAPTVRPEPIEIRKKAPPPAANHPWKRGCRDMPERPVWAAR
jgi:hypothetical protein